MAMNTKDDGKFAGMTLLRKERAVNLNFDLYDDKNVQSIFVDGLSEVLLSSFVSKLTFHIVSSVDQEEGNDTPIETRIVRTRIAIPTTVLIEMVTNVQQLLMQHALVLEHPLQQAIEKLRSMAENKSE